MRIVRVAIPAAAGFSILLLSLAGVRAQDPEELAPDPQKGCTFAANPDEFLQAQARAQTETFQRVRKFAEARQSAGAERNVRAADVPRRSFIDDEIFGRLALANVAAAAMTTDEEFVRRIYLDLTGRIPTREQINDFLGKEAANKRDELIENLLFSREFTDRWTMWVGDWLGNNVNLSTAANQRMINGRNAFFNYIKGAVETNKSIRDLAWESVAASGASYDDETGAVNFALGASAAMGPIQDTYDLMLYKSASTFLGLGHYDCLACHNGRGHLDQISLWGRTTTRMEAWRMSAFFSRMRLTRTGTGQFTNPRYNNIDISDATTGDYVLNTNNGNRPERCANNTPLGPGNRCVATANLQPEYRYSALKPKTASWRASFADYMVDDPMFARNFVNRIWKQMFGLGLVDPVDTLDPARLDPKNPPPAPWTMQATHPELLERLASEFVNSGYDMRNLIGLIARSSAYQLSSRYEGEWKYEYTPLFARHYPRRLEAEEVHDAISLSTGVPARYTWSLADGQTIAQNSPQPQSDPVAWAMQLPDTVEPRNNGGVATFLNAFLRGNRDTAQRHQAGSILQQLSLMNDRFVTTRVKVAASPVLRDLARITDNNHLTDEVFLNFLSRRPSSRERTAAVRFLERSTNRNAAIEDLSWAAVNKVDFIYSY